VDGYIEESAEEDEPSPELSEGLIEEQEFQTEHGPVTRIRCPRCGQWTQPDRAEPAD
jgi:hypothetical protein